jgi:hypothetical protein
VWALKAVDALRKVEFSHQDGQFYYLCLPRSGVDYYRRISKSRTRGN